MNTLWYLARGLVLTGIDVQLQQRHDLISNVLTIAKRFMEARALAAQ